MSCPDFPDFAVYFSKIDPRIIFTVSPLQLATADSLLYFWMEAALHY